MIVLKHIDMTLDPDSIQNAIKVIEDLQEELGTAMTELIRELTEQGAEFARMEIAMFERPAIDTGALSASITGEVVNDHEGRIYTNVEYAVYVEYGTGVIGDMSGHPERDRLGIQYDLNGHGWDGWTYKGRDGKFHHTYGMESRPFMYYTLRDLEKYVEQNGGQIVAEYIP